jgi:hypothetical protein
MMFSVDTSAPCLVQISGLRISSYSYRITTLPGTNCRSVLQTLVQTAAQAQPVSCIHTAREIRTGSADKSKQKATERKFFPPTQSCLQGNENLNTLVADVCLIFGYPVSELRM